MVERGGLLTPLRIYVPSISESNLAGVLFEPLDVVTEGMQQLRGVMFPLCGLDSTFDPSWVRSCARSPWRSIALLSVVRQSGEVALGFLDYLIRLGVGVGQGIALLA